MERSNFANVLITTRLLPHFTTDNMEAIKSCIFQQLQCNSEPQFYCKLLKMIHKSLSNESTKIIKSKAIEIAELQQLQINSKIADPLLTNDNDNNETPTPKLTICKYIENQYNDVLSNLNSDIIDCIGAFLTKQESIEFGYINIQLYIETQKLSYLLNRRKDTTENKPFVLNRLRLQKLLSPISSAYSYSCPINFCLLDLGKAAAPGSMDIFSQYNNVCTQTDFLRQFFLRLNVFKCFGYEYLCNIPVDLLFNKENNFYDSNESREYIKQFSIFSSKSIDDKDVCVSSIKQFCQKLSKYKKDNYCKMRKIKKFIFSTSLFNDVSKKLFLICCGISESIDVRCDLGKIGISSLNEVKSMFHKEMKKFYLRPDYNMMCVLELLQNMNVACAIDVNNDDIDDMKERALQLQIGMLEELEIHTCSRLQTKLFGYAPNDTIMKIFKVMDKLGMRKRIKQYTIYWEIEKYSIGNELMNGIFFNDYDKHPLLEKVTLVVNEPAKIRRVSRYFKQHKYKLFVDNGSCVKLGLKHLRKIELKIEQQKHINCFKQNIKIHTVYNATIQHPIDQHEIQVENINQYIDAIDDNILDWLQRILKAKEEIGDRKIVLIICR